MKAKILSLEEAKIAIASKGLKTRQDYLHYVKENQIINLSLTPEPHYYHKGWSGWANFLGISKEDYEFNKRTRTRSYAKVHQEKLNSTNATKFSKVQEANNTDVGLNPDDVISFLIKNDVAPETIVKMVADLDIKSSTLMNDLCKYMHERSKRQSEVWRPTGYNTAEPQMSTNI
jgi:hypothetical protein